MKNKVLSLIAASALVTASVVALAQQPASPVTSPAATAPAASTAPITAATPTQAGSYTGPSSAPLSTVKALLANGKDGQYVRLQGKILSHEREKNYTFADDSGSMPVQISQKRFPPGQTISADQRVELTGKLDKEWFKTEFEVKEIRLLP